MANGKLSFSVAINLLTDQFNNQSNKLKNSLRSIQMQFISLAGAMGAGIGFSSFISNMIGVARETNKVDMILKNVSSSSEIYGRNQKFLIDLSRKYNLELNNITGTFAKFTASANLMGVPLEKQEKIFDAFSKQIVKFGGGAETTTAVFTALEQMFSKGTIQAQEMKIQLGNALPGAVGLFAKALGVTTGEFTKMMEQGKLLSTDVLPKVAEYLEKMGGNVDVNTVEGSMNKLKNLFKEFTDKLNVGDIYKNLLDQTGNGFKWLMDNFKMVGNAIVNIVTTVIIGKAFKYIIVGYKNMATAAVKSAVTQELLNVKLSASSRKRYLEESMAVVKFGTVFKFTMASIGASIKAAFMSFLPILIISGIVSIVQKLVEWKKKQDEIKAIWTDYQKEVKNAGNNSDEITKMKSLLRIINNRFESQLNINKAQKELQGILGTEVTNQKELNKLVGKRIELIKESARAQIYSDKIVSSENKIDELSSTIGMTTEQVQTLVKSYIRNGVNKNGFVGNQGAKTFQQDIGREVANTGNPSNYKLDEIIDVVKSVARFNAVINDATPKLDKSIKKTIETNTGGGKPYKPKKDLTDLEKVDENYKKELNELTNTISNNIDNVDENNILIDKFNKKYKEDYDKVGTPQQLKNNVNYQTVIKGVNNPKQNIIDKKLNNETKKYTDEVIKLKKLFELKRITEIEYNEKLSNLIDSTVESVVSIDDIGDSADKFVNFLDGVQKEIPKKINKKDQLKKYDYKSKYDEGTTEKEKAQYNFEKAKNELQDLKESAVILTDEIIKELDNKLANVEGLDKVLNLIVIKEKIIDLKKELNKGIYSGIKDIANSAKNVYEAFKSVGDVISNVDSTGWDKFLAIWNAITNTIDSVLSVVSMIESVIDLTNKLTDAKKNEQQVDDENTTKKVSNVILGAGATVAGAAVETTANETVSGSNVKAGVTGVLKTTANTPLPFPLNLIAIAGAVATVAGIIGTISSMSKFAGGGIVGGGSIGGDNILARVNSGEMILNTGQQSTLFNLLNNGSSGISNSTNSNVKFVIEGKNLVGTINNYNKIKSKVK